MPSSLTERIDRVLRLSIATEQRQARRLAAARRLEARRQVMLDAAAERVAQAMELAGMAAAELDGAALDSRRMALDVARGQFAAAAVAHRDAVVRRDSESRSLEAVQRTRRNMARLRASQWRWDGAA